MKIGETQRQASNKCLSCGKGLNACAPVDNERKLDVAPSPGDITICFHCGNLMAYTANLSYRELTGEEMHYIAEDARILSIQRARSTIQ